MEELHAKPNSAADFQNLTSSLLESLVAETAIFAHKSLLLLPFLVWSPTNNTNVLPDLVRTDQRLPMSKFTQVKEPDAENNNAGEAVDDEDGDSDGDDEDDGNDSDEDSDDDDDDDDDDDEDDSDDEVVPSGYGDSDDDEDDDSDDDEDDDEDDDSDEETDEDDDEEDEDDEEQFKLPPERKK